MNKVFKLSVLLLVLGSSASFAQEVEYEGIVSQFFFARIADRVFDLDFQGVGARTLGMGGAGIAADNELSAMHWNPANATLLSSAQITLHGCMDLDQRELTSPPRSGIKIGSTINPGVSVSLIAAAYPFKLGSRQLVLGCAYQSLNNMTNKMEDMQYYYGGGRLKEETKTNGGIHAVTPSVAIDIIPQISMGVTYNYLIGNSDFTLELGSPYADRTIYFEFKDEEEYNGSYVNVGVTVKPIPWLCLGLVTTPAWDFVINEKKESTRILTSTGANNEYDVYETPDDSLTEYEAKMPLTYGIGLALKPLRMITLAADYQVKPWSNTEFTADKQSLEHELVDAEILRLGAEWILSTGVWSMPLRFGYYTTPTPYKDKWFRDHYEGDQIEGEVWTFGIGYIRDHIAIDFAFERGSHEMRWWMDAGDYYNNRMFISKDTFNKVTLAFTYQM
jgi:hypothetical protein